MGEPLLHKNAYELLEYAAKRMQRTFLVTNGSLLTEAKAEKLFRTGITDLDISYYASNEDNFNLRHARNLSFDLYKKRIRQVVRTKFVNGYRTPLRLHYSSINLPLHRWDRSDNQQSFLSLNQINENVFEWILFMKKLRQDLELKIDINQDLEAINKEDVKNPIRYFITDDFEIVTKSFHNWGNAQADVKKAVIGKCEPVLSHNEVDILHNGDVVLCCVDYEGETKVGNVSDRSLTDVLSDKQYRRVIRDFSWGVLPFERCKTCFGASKCKEWLIRQIGTCITNLRLVKPVVKKLRTMKKFRNFMR